MTELETLQARVEQLAHDLAESRKAEMDAVMAIADIREACGDNGRRILPDLVAYVRECYELAQLQKKRKNAVLLKQAAEVIEHSVCRAILNPSPRRFNSLDGRLGE